MDPKDPESARIVSLMDPKEIFMTPVQQLEEREERSQPAPCTAEVAECTCPEFCERDH